ncbi:hypothetical protein AAW14_05085 [Streptomyces hygroscopicus]|nr:hypothetical protein [Streptomyces hygroscopicus]
MGPLRDPPQELGSGPGKACGAVRFTAPLLLVVPPPLPQWICDTDASGHAKGPVPRDVPAQLRFCACPQ